MKYITQIVWEFWLISLVWQKMHFIHSHVATVPNIQLLIPRTVGHHSQDAAWWSEFKAHIYRLPFQQIKSEDDLGVLSVCDVQNTTSYECITSLGPGVGRVHRHTDREALLIQLGHHYVFIITWSKYKPQSIFINCQLEVGLRVGKEIG